MKFAHISDCHIGGWREPKLKELNLEAFVKAIETCINEKIDFVLITGDLFNTSLPQIDYLKTVVKLLKKLKDNDIKVYVIAGSHDFSPSGKTMIDVLENAGLVINVAKGTIENKKLKLKFTIDEKTGAKITGMLGRKGGLEKHYYEDLIKENLEKEDGFKIFMFHTAITELKPKEYEEMESQPLSLLPKNFNYYAGGHIHEKIVKKIPGYGLIVYPGALFPNNFKELEKFKTGGFYIYDNGKLVFKTIQVKNVYSINIDCNHKTPKQIEHEIIEHIKNKEFNETIVTIRLEGVLEAGKPNDINFKDIFNKLYEKSAYFVMKNIAKLQSKELKEVKIGQGSVEEIEEKLIKEHSGKIKLKNLKPEEEVKLIKRLMNLLNKEKEEGETSEAFKKRILDDLTKIFDV